MMAIGDMRADIEIRPITKGQIATFEVEGGYARKPAPCDGLLIESAKATVFIPATEAIKALKTLQRSSEKVAARTAGPER